MPTARAACADTCIRARTCARTRGTRLHASTLVLLVLAQLVIALVLAALVRAHAALALHDVHTLTARTYGTRLHICNPRAA